MIERFRLIESGIEGMTDSSPTSKPPQTAAEGDIVLGKQLTIAVWVITVLVWLLVGLMRMPNKFPLPEGVSLGFLPTVHAILNSLVSIALVTALVMIKKGKVVMHQRMITVAMIGSALFLLCYVAYHFTNA